MVGFRSLFNLLRWSFEKDDPGMLRLRGKLRAWKQQIGKLEQFRGPLCLVDSYHPIAQLLP